MQIFDVLLDNEDYIDGEWTTFEGKLPEGVYILRCTNKKGEWFNHKARFDPSKGWTEQSAEEYVRKANLRSHKAEYPMEGKQLSLSVALEGAETLTPEQIEERKRQELIERERRLRDAAMHRRSLRSILGVEEDIERMKPEDVKLNHIYVGDCVQVMKRLPSNYFDAVITDPPYNLGKSYKSGIDDALRDKDYYEWSYRWIDEAVRTLKPNGQLLIALWDRFKYHIKVYIDEAHSDKLRFIQEIAWKTTGVPRAPSGKLRSDMTPWLHFGPSIKQGQRVVNYTWNLDTVRSWKFVVQKDEDILLKNKRYIHPLGKDPSTLMEFYKEEEPNEFRDVGANFYVLNWFRKFLETFADYSMKHAVQLFNMPSNIINQRNLPSTHRDRLDHPCQMPVEVPMQLIKLVTNPGDRILEPFNGTGTTAHAATVLGRHCLSIELSPDYAVMAHERMNRAYIKRQAAIEYWDGRPPAWTVDECKPQFIDSRQKSLLDFFAIGTAGGKRLGDDLVADVTRELQGNLLSILTGE